jgi:hypothetical protein
MYQDILDSVAEYVEDKFTFQFVNKASYKNLKFNNRMFVDTCKKGHLPVAQWLIQFNPDVHAWNDSAFRLAHENGQLHVTQWLMQFNPCLEWLVLINFNKH